MIDLLDNPDSAIDTDILAIPTLIRRSPRPFLRIVGEMSDSERVWGLLTS
ncbi:MAG: hypothetical protein HKN11_18505 [Rhizobiales bacterium]|nr:hypothetical protein [Hyphomicrobiales bacterium]